MTVAELIAKLAKCKQDYKVLMMDDDNNTWEIVTVEQSADDDDKVVGVFVA